MNSTAAELDARWERVRAHLAAQRIPAAVGELEAIVARDRREASAWLLLAGIAQSAQHCRATVAYARNAAAAVVESGDLRPLGEVALLLQNIGESSLALRLLRGVDADAPAARAQAGQLAQCFSLADCQQEALDLVDRALDRSGPNLDLVYARATVLRYLGRAEEATAEYLRCLDFQPHHAMVILMLAQHAPRLDAAAQAARAREALAALPEGDVQARMQLHYALFILLDALGDTAAAWKALAEGARLKRQSLVWEPARDEARVAALREVCTPAFLQPVEAAAERVPIFIVGQPRTGTTVLERILGNHSQVASAGELNDFHLQLCWQADMLAEHVDPALVRTLAQADFGAIGRGYRQRVGWRGEGRRFLVDKLPINFWYAGFIHKALPEAKILCLVRDPLDACFSNLKELFVGEGYPYSYDPLEAAAHHVHFREMLAHWNEVMPGAVLSVGYEDMVRDPESMARRVMDFCGLPFEPGCVDIVRNTSPSATASSSQIREPIHARGIGAWRRYAEPLAPMEQWLRERLPAQAFAAD